MLPLLRFPLNIILSAFPLQPWIINHPCSDTSAYPIFPHHLFTPLVSPLIHSPVPASFSLCYPSKLVLACCTLSHSFVSRSLSLSFLPFSFRKWISFVCTLAYSPLGWFTRKPPKADSQRHTPPPEITLGGLKKFSATKTVCKRGTAGVVSTERTTSSSKG